MMRRREKSCRSVALIVAAAMLTGCVFGSKRKPPELAAPRVDVAVTHFAGTALSGPQARPIDASAAWGVHVRLSAIESAAPAGFERIGPDARLVLAPDVGTVATPSARIVYSTLLRALPGDEPFDVGRQAALGDREAAIAPGATAAVSVSLPESTPRSTFYSRRAIRVLVSRPLSGEAYDLSVVSDDLTGAAGGRTAREVVVIRRTRDAGRDRVALAIPITFPQSAARAIVIELTLDDAPSDSARTALTDQAAAASAAIAAARDAVAPTSDELALARALDALQQGELGSRGALAFLAERAGASLAQSVILVADDRLLQVIAGQLQTRIVNLASRDRRSVAWLIDRATIDAIASIDSDDAASVLPPVRGALSVYAGEVGRQVDVMKSLAGESTSGDDLYNRIIAENLILLEESSPGLRVRAFDWLRSIGRAPSGYEPLATPQQRRSALERAREPAPLASATQATTAPMGAPSTP